MRRLRVIVLSAWISLPASAEPFLATARVPTELGVGVPSRIALPAGFELMRPTGPEWGAVGIAGPTGSGVRGFGLAAATNLAGARLQLTAGRWGTAYYGEQRAAVAGVLGGGAGVGLLLETRSVRMDGFATRRAAGTGWLVHGRVLGLEGVFAPRPSGRLGERALFPGGWSAVISCAGSTGAVALCAESREEAFPRVRLDVWWSGPGWALDTSLDLSTSGLSVGLGVGRRAFCGFSRVRYHGLLGVAGTFGVMGETR